MVSQISIMNVGISNAPRMTNIHHDGTSNTDATTHSSTSSTSGTSTSTSTRTSTSTINMCKWTPGGPVFFNLNTKLGVSYEGGHWFHMAENFMTAHSSLRRSGLLANINSTAVGGEAYYNFDNPRFVKELNGLTKLIVALGTVGALVPAGGSLASEYAALPMSRRVKALHYAYIPRHTRLGGGSAGTGDGTGGGGSGRQRPAFSDSINATATATATTTASSSSSDTAGSVGRPTTVTTSDPPSPVDLKISDLRPGDTFLLRPEWAQVQQTEVLWPVQVYAKKMFMGGQLSLGGYGEGRGREGGRGLRGGGRGRRRLAGSGYGYVNGTEGMGGDAGVGVGGGMGGGVSDHSDNPPNSLWRPPHPHTSSPPPRVADVCVRYQGSVGGEWPTPQRGHWFPHTGDVQSFRAKLRQLCPPNVHEVGGVGRGCGQ